MQHSLKHRIYADSAADLTPRLIAIIMALLNVPALRCRGLFSVYPKLPFRMYIFVDLS